MNANLDVRAFNEVRELKKEFNDSLIKKRFRDKSRIFSFEGSGSTIPIKSIDFEGIAGTLLNLKVEATLNTSQIIYVKFNSIIIYKVVKSENFGFELDLELSSNNTIEFYSDGEIFVQAKLRGNIDIQELDNIEIIKLMDDYHVITNVGGKTYYSSYNLFDSLKENIVLRSEKILDNYISYSNLISDLNSQVYNDNLVVLTGNTESGFIIKQSDEDFTIEHSIEYSYNSGSILPMVSDFYKFGIVAFENNSFFINYYNSNYEKVNEVGLNYSLKYPIKYIGGFEYVNKTDFNHHGFWFIDKNNDAYLVLSIDGKVQKIKFHNSPAYLGKASRVKVYSKGNEFIIYLSYDNMVTKIILNISHDSYSLNVGRKGKTSIKNVDFGFLDNDEDYYYSNGCITKLT